MERIFHEVHIKVIYHDDEEIDTREMSAFSKVERSRFSEFANQFIEEENLGIVRRIARVDNTGAFDYFDKIIRSRVIMEILDWSKEDIEWVIEERIGSLDIVKEISSIVCLPGTIRIKN